MAYSYVLINFDDMMKRAVLEQLKKIHGVTEITDLEKQGELLIKVEANSEDHVRSIVVWKIQKMNCVNHVLTLGKNKKL